MCGRDVLFSSLVTSFINRTWMHLCQSKQFSLLFAGVEVCLEDGLVDLTAGQVSAHGGGVLIEPGCDVVAHFGEGPALYTVTGLKKLISICLTAY